MAIHRLATYARPSYWHWGKDVSVTRIGLPSGPHMHWLQRLRPLAHILSHCAHDLSYNEFRTESWCAAFHKVVLARLNIDIFHHGAEGMAGVTIVLHHIVHALG
jgi:hypothetical protein